MKQILKHPLFIIIASFLMACFIRLTYYSSRCTRVIPASAQSYFSGNSPLIIAFWHGRMMLMPMFSPSERKMHVLISQHNDGELIARTMHHFNFSTIRGSSSRGGAAAAAQVVRILKQGDSISITPDGPRGPSMEASMGIITLARLSGIPILPVTFSTTHHKHAKSWDRFLIAKPFGKIAFIAGEPLWVAEDADAEAMEQMRQRLETSMRKITEQADSMCGIS